MNVLVAFLGYKSKKCLPNSKCLKSMPIAIFFWGGAGKCLGGAHPPTPPRKSTPGCYMQACHQQFVASVLTS